MREFLIAVVGGFVFTSFLICLLIFAENVT